MSDSVCYYCEQAHPPFTACKSFDLKNVCYHAKQKNERLSPRIEQLEKWLQAIDEASIEETLSDMCKMALRGDKCEPAA